MARSYYTCPSCGKRIEVEGCNASSAASKAQWLSKKGEYCYECRIAQENAEAAAIAETRGFAKLEGTEKQVAWAESIRTHGVELAETRGESALADWLAGLTSAKFIIDNRDDLRRIFGLEQALDKVEAEFPNWNDERQMAFLGECYRQFGPFTCKDHPRFQALRAGRDVLASVRRRRA